MNKLFSKITSAAIAMVVSLFVLSGSLQTFVNAVDAHATEADIILGDVNDDGRINVFDLCLMKKKIISTSTISINESAADVNADGIVDVNDVIEVQQFLLVERDTFTGTVRRSIEPPDTSIITANEPIETAMTSQMADKAKELGNVVNVYSYGNL